MNENLLPNALKSVPVIYARLPRKLYQQFAVLAKRQGTTRSAYVRRLVRDEVERTDVLLVGDKDRVLM